MPMTRNIDSEQEFNDIRTAGNYDYTVDDFINEYRVSKRLADTLLKDIDHISISQSLYIRLSEVDRKKFYNRVEVFKSLVNSGKLCFYVKHFDFMWLGTRKKDDNSILSGRLQPGYIFNRLDIFLHILNEAKTPREVTSMPHENKEKVNRHYNRIEGVEVRIGTQIRRLYKLDKNDKYYGIVIKMIWLPVEMLDFNDK